MPEVNTAIAPTPLIAEALVMLHKGMGDELQPHLLALMRNLQPLLAMANEELKLNWDLSQLDKQ
jgi:hypothetical protein